MRRNTAIVFAHQDDDLIWMLPFWESAHSFLLAAYAAPTTCLSVVAQHSEEYRQRWVPIWGTVTDDEFATVFLQPTRNAIVTRQAIKDRLRGELSRPEVEQIVTHNNWGEYGHVQHRLVNEAVRELAVELGKDVWSLDVVAFAAPRSAHLYLDPGDLDLETINMTFDHPSFARMRRLYQETYFSIPSPAGSRSAWTWHPGEFDYPHGRRRFVKLVDAGKDLTIQNAEIATLVDRVRHVLEGNLAPERLARALADRVRPDQAG